MKAKMAAKETSTGDQENPDPLAEAEGFFSLPRPFSSHGCPVSLRAFLKSSGREMGFKFELKEEEGQRLRPLEETVERRVLGKKVRYELVKGSFEVADESQPIKDFVEKSGKGIEDIFEIKFDSDPWMHVGIRPGIKIPIITNCPQSTSGLLDTRPCLFLPFAKDKNLFAELPSAKMTGAFFTTQRIGGTSEVIVAEDKGMGKVWVVLIGRVVKQNSKGPKIGTEKYGSDEAPIWQPLAENLFFGEKLLELLIGQGCQPKIKFRVCPDLAGDSKDDEDAILMDTYFRDEIITNGKEMSLYTYKESCLVYGFFENSQWSFGLKDITASNGTKLILPSPKALKTETEDAIYPL